MNEAEIKRLISQAVCAALLREQAEASSSALTEKPDTGEKRTLVLVPGLAPFGEAAVRELKRRYGDNGTAVTFGHEAPLVGVQTMEASSVGETRLLRLTEAAERVVLLAPSLKLLSDLAAGKDDDLPTYLFLHALLWGKRTAAFLDFPAPKRGTLLAGSGAADCLDALESAGVEWVYYREQPEGEARETISLLTEEDVLRAFRAGQKALRLQPGAIVTPLAKDAARERGVQLTVLEAI